MEYLGYVLLTMKKRSADEIAVPPVLQVKRRKYELLGAPTTLEGLEHGQILPTAAAPCQHDRLDAERLEGRVRAAHIRERMRALGPTVRLDLGKQAEGKGAGFAAPEGE